jgi:(1->4)-alpha-D-glucan 1-alpha-D-glucosylmutase
MQRYMQKAMREAKARTSWLEPSPAHEEAVAGFIERILDPVANPAFVQDVDAFVARIAPAGVLNALAQTAIKAWAPGVPDFYQGTEGWAFDLVDPDNRRPVDYGRHVAAARAAEAFLRDPSPARAADWLAAWRDGRIKVLVSVAALRARAAAPELFALGRYEAVAFEGADAERLFGFARVHEDDWRVLIVPRMQATADRRRAAGATRVRLPRGAPSEWLNLVNGQRAAAASGSFDPDPLLAGVPIALLTPA